MIKVINKRIHGSLFHYAHFLCDCLFPEIVNNLQNYDVVVREKNINQTIGNFSKIYTEVMNNKNMELSKNEFDDLNVKTLKYNPKEKYMNRFHFSKFRNFIFKRYEINPLKYEINYPEVILIKRGERINLIDDEQLKKLNRNITTGKERREIDNIDNVDIYLKKKFGNKYKSLYFENIPFKEQVKYFNNAKIIICSHGAVMSNMFFCKSGATIIEVVCNTKWFFFDKISSILNLNHIKCVRNKYEDVIKCIEMNL